MNNGDSIMNFSQLVTSEGLFCDGDWIEKKDQDPNGSVRLIQLADIGVCEFKDRSNRFITESKAEELHCTYLQKGDILIARLPDPLGRACIFPFDGKFITAVDVAVVRVARTDVNPKYVMYLINSPRFRNEIKKYESGTTRKRISRKNLDKIEFELPSLADQNHIVARIEELFSELDNGVETLRKTKQQLAVYRQAVLKAAFRSVSSRADEKTMGSILIGIEGGKSFKCEERPPQEHEYGIVKVSAVTWGTYNELESKTCRADQFLPTKRIGSGDFLFSRANTLELIGNCVVVEKVSRELMLSDKILRFHFVDGIVPKYVMYFLRTHDGKKQIQALSTGNQESMRNIGQDRIRKIQIPICSVEDQNSVVTKIESRLSVCDSIEKTVDTALQQAEAMRQSILKQAFM